MPRLRLKSSTLVRDLVRVSLRLVRRFPALHSVVHTVAVQASRQSWGARLIRSILEPQYPSAREYAIWIRDFDTLNDAEIDLLRTRVQAFQCAPLISIVMPVCDPELRHLVEAIASVRRQFYPNWELCIVDDASRDDSIWNALLAEAAIDPRIKILKRRENGHVCAATNDAIGLTTGAFIAFMDHDDLLADCALYEVAAVLEVSPNAQLVYSDEDKIDASGVRSDPYFKPDWDGELILSQNFVNHLAVFRRERVLELGGLREGFEGAQDHDLVLRFTEGLSSSGIIHIARVLYHWRQLSGAKTFSESSLERCHQASRRAVADHFARLGDKLASVSAGPASSVPIVVIRAPSHPLKSVSVIIPTRDRADLLEICVSSLMRVTDYDAYEILIVDNDSIEDETAMLFFRLEKDPRVRLIHAPGPFNYSKINNQAAANAKGEILIFLNNDIEVREREWMSALVAQAERPTVGAVGAKLYYGDGRIQHGGIVLGVGRDIAVAGNLYSGAAANDPGYFNHLRMARNLSAVTGACLAIRKAVFQEVGGFNEVDLPIAYNDVDICLRVRGAGYQVIWTPYAELTHLESASRGSDDQASQLQRYATEISYMRRKWEATLERDPFYGPNFDRVRGD